VYLPSLEKSSESVVTNACTKNYDNSIGTQINIRIKLIVILLPL